MDQIEPLNIFFQEKHTETKQQHHSKEQPLPQSVPYLQRGDSSKYLDQFLLKNQTPKPQQVPKQEPKKVQSSSHEHDQDYSVSSKGKFNPSAFHNFQKHLTVCLKHSIQIKANQQDAADYQVVAARLWRTFKTSPISTKKVLHYLLGEKNQHKITDAGLKQFGLFKIYQEAGPELTKEARKYLAQETLKQIAEGRLDQYITAKKLKDKNKFRKYVKIFEEELSDCFLRKRLPKEKVLELQRA